MNNPEFHLNYLPHADEDLKNLIHDPAKKGVAKAVLKSLQMMTVNLKHPSLNTHKYHGLYGPNGEEIFESYDQNHTPGAYRSFWFYGPQKNEISILRICPHP